MMKHYIYDIKTSNNKFNSSFSHKEREHFYYKCMENNEKRVVALIVEFDERLKNARQYIKEHYGIDSHFDRENGILNLHPIKEENKANILAAQKYVNDILEGSITFNPPLPESENPYWE